MNKKYNSPHYDNEGDFFMKKIIFGFMAIIIVFILYKKEDLVIIPNESIRIRVIANSNNIDDLLIKNKIKTSIEHYFNNLLKDSIDINEARYLINNNLDKVEEIIKKDDINNYSINYGLNYFPKKIYKGVLYREGEYESIEIRLGKGIGSNYWCVLFPPLCLLEENKLVDDVYKSYVKEVIIDK